MDPEIEISGLRVLLMILFTIAVVAFAVWSVTW